MKDRILHFLKNKSYCVASASAGTTTSSSMVKDDFLSTLPGFSIILLVVTLYFVAAAIRTYGGKIGHSLNIIGVGIFFVALKELLYFSSIVDHESFLHDLYTNSTFMQTFNYTTNIIIFALLSYGFYSMTKVFNTNTSPKKEEKK